MRNQFLSLTVLSSALAVLIAFTPGGGAKEADSAKERKVGPVYSVDVYDPARDAAEDLEATVKRATAGKKRILIQLGGNWCGWCRAMGKYFYENERVAAALAGSFIIMKVNYSDENRNSFFLRDFPNFESFPHLYVLDSKGKVLHSQPTEGFERLGTTYREKPILEFLDKWDGKD